MLEQVSGFGLAVVLQEKEQSACTGGDHNLVSPPLLPARAVKKPISVNLR